MWNPQVWRADCTVQSSPCPMRQKLVTPQQAGSRAWLLQSPHSNVSCTILLKMCFLDTRFRITHRLTISTQVLLLWKGLLHPWVTASVGMVSPRLHLSLWPTEACSTFKVQRIGFLTPSHQGLQVPTLLTSPSLQMTAQCGMTRGTQDGAWGHHHLLAARMSHT